MSVILLSTLISGLGVSTYFIAVNWFIEQASNSSISVAIVNSLCYLLILLFLPYIGIWCDKFFRKHILIIIYFFGAILQLFLSIVITQTNPKIGMLVMLILTTGIISVIRSTDQICRTAYLQNIMRPDKYQLTNRWLEAIRQGITFIAGGLAAFLMKNPSIAVVLNFSVATFIVGALLIFILPKDSIHTKKPVYSGSYFKKVMNGYSILKNIDKKIVFILIASIFPYAAVVSLNVTYPAFFYNLRTSNVAQFYAALSIPYGAGALFASYVHKKETSNFNRFFIIHSLIFLIALVFGAVISNVYFTYLVLSTIAYCHASIRIQRNTFIMEYVQNKNIGQVLSFFEIIFTITVVILSFSLGFICDIYSPSQSWLFVALVYLLLIILIFNRTKHSQITSI